MVQKAGFWAIIMQFVVVGDSGTTTAAMAIQSRLLAFRSSSDSLAAVAAVALLETQLRV